MERNMQVISWSSQFNKQRISWSIPLMFMQPIPESHILYAAWGRSFRSHTVLSPRPSFIVNVSIIKSFLKKPAHWKSAYMGRWQATKTDWLTYWTPEQYAILLYFILRIDKTFKLIWNQGDKSTLGWCVLNQKTVVKQCLVWGIWNQFLFTTVHKNQHILYFNAFFFKGNFL